jgi:hypothetical protein
MRRPSLFFDIGAEDKSGRAFSSLHSGLSETERRSQRARATIMAFGAAAVAAVTGIGVAAIRGASDIDEVAKASRRLEMDIGSFRALQLVASEAGVSVEGLTGDIQNMAREIESGSRGATQAANRLGLSLSELRSMDADTRLEVIADRMRDLGLNAGESSQLLRQFEIRNREMVLMMMQGGDAMRNARRDIADYGLALSSVDASRIETANDQIARLGLVSRAAADRLALSIVPALGAMANAITDSLREGGLLRGFLEAVPGYAAAAGIAIAAYYTPAILAATVQTAFWVAGLVTLRGALIATGIGAFIVLAGTMINYLMRLVENTGSWGNALALLGEVARGVWEGIVASAQAIPAGLNAVWAGIEYGFIRMVISLRNTWADFLGSMSDTLRDSGLNIGGVLDGVADSLDAASARVSMGTQRMAGMSNDAMAAATAAQAEYAGQMEGAWARATSAVDRLMDAVNGLGEFAPAEISEVTGAAAALNTAFETAAAGGGRAASAVAEVGAAAEAATESTTNWASTLSGAFDGIITGGKSASDVLRQIARQMESRGWQMLFQGFGGGGAGGGGGGWLSRLFAGFFDGGGTIPAGQFGVVGERGPELVRGPANVTSRADTARMMGGGGETRVVVELRSDMLDARIEGGAGRVVRASTPGIVGQSVQATHASFDRRAPA